MLDILEGKINKERVEANFKKKKINLGLEIHYLGSKNVV